MPDELVDNSGSTSLPSAPTPEPKAPSLSNPQASYEAERDVPDAELLSALSEARAGRPETDDEGPPGDKSLPPGLRAHEASQPKEPKDAEPVDPKVAAQVDAAVRQRAEAAESRERELRQYRDQGSRIVQEAEAYAQQRRKQADDEAAQLMADLRRDPIEAAKKAGWDPVELVGNIAKFDSPEGRMERRMLQIEADNKKLRDEIATRDRTAQEQQQQATQQAQRRQVEDAFVTELTTKYPGVDEHFKRPGMRDFYIQQAHTRANELAASRGPSDPPLTYGEVAEWLGTTYGFGQAPTPPKGAPATTAAGKAARGLTQAAQSERSGGDGRRFHDLSEAEQDKILLEEQRTRSRQRQVQR